jgi:hypothetical protein
VEKFDVTLMAKLLPFAVVAERGKRSQSWTFVANAGASRRGMDCRLSPLASRCLVSKYQY